MRSSARYLTTRQASAVYDRVGRWQDTQSFYEHPAVDELVRAGDFATASHVLEIGCGTGALAARLLARSLPADARYTALDVSGRMVQLTHRRLQQWAHRVEVTRVEGDAPWPVPDESVDRVIATYVLDLLSPEATQNFFAEAGRVLVDGGLVAVTSLTTGPSGAARAVSTLWTRLWRISPRLTAGCRPVDLPGQLPGGWHTRFTRRVTSYGITSQILVVVPSRSTGSEPG